MQLLINGNQFIDPAWLAAGGEGEIYSLNATSVAKVYFEQFRTDQRKQKVLALCDSYANFSTKHAGCSIAFPETPAYEITTSFDSLVGFSMALYACPTIGELGYDLKRGEYSSASGVRFEDSTATKFVYELFSVVEQLHQSRIILGDVNPGNIMCDPATRKPVLIDIDAAQIGGFPCQTTHELYNDPRLASRGKGLGGALAFDFGTDIFAMAVVCFEFLVGVRPHQLHVAPPRKDTENKAAAISSIKCLSAGRDYLAKLGVAYFNCPENETIERRIKQIKILDPRLYKFFEAVFVADDRDNLLFLLPLTDAKHPGHHFFVESGFIDVLVIEAKKRQQQQRRTAVLNRQGLGQPSTMPDSGFRNIINSFSSPAVRGATAFKRPPTMRADPDAFNVFLKHFNLTSGV